MKFFIETERLILRDMHPEDCEGMFALDSDPEVLRFLWMKPLTKIEQSIEAVNFIREQYQTNGIGRWAVILKDTSEFIGWGGLKLVTSFVNNQTNFYDLGYRLLQKHWGKGYATEISKATLNYGFEKMELAEICAYAMQEHKASRRVLEKAGLKFIEDFEHDELKDSWYKITREEYTEQNRKS